MKYYKVFKNLQEYEVVQAESPIEAQWKPGFVPFRVVECNEDGSSKVTPGYKKVKTNKK